ncbi:pyridoxal phosphate-dependent aminotransferase [Thalassotalea piscium]
MAKTSLMKVNTSIAMPAHIAYSRSLKAEVTINLSHSCAQTMTLAELIQFNPTGLNDISLEYASLAGSETLRQSICDYYQLYNQGTKDLTANQVLTFCGGQEALSAIYRTILVPGDEVIVFTPCYPSLVTMAEGLGCQVKQVTLKEANNWEIDFTDVEALMSAKTKLLVLNSPHNPTGSIIDLHLSDKILALAIKYQCYLLADEVSHASNYFNLPLSNHYLSYDKAISVGVMSKSLGLAGIRIGWLLTKNQQWLEQLTAVKASGSICISAIDQAAAIMAFQQSSNIIAKNNTLIKANIEEMDAFVNEYSHLFQWHPPKAGMLALVRYLGDEGIELLSQTLASQYGVLVLPSRLFGLPGDFFRLGLGQQNFTQGLKALRDYCNNL